MIAFDREAVCPPEKALTLLCVHIPLTVDLALHAAPFCLSFVLFEARVPKLSQAESVWCEQLILCFALYYALVVELCANINGSCE